MLSFKVEYALRILVEMRSRELAGIRQVPGEWLKNTCGNDANGMSIVLRILRHLEWLSYDRNTYMYSVNSDSVNIDNLTLYDLCIHVDESLNSIAKPLRDDNISKSLDKLFGDIKLSGFIDTGREELKAEELKVKS